MSTNKQGAIDFKTAPLTSVLFLWLVIVPARAEITLEWDFDHGALREAGTTVTDTLITLGPRSDIYSSRWIYCQASGVLGLDPEFRNSNSHVAGSSLGDTHRYVYSYDQEIWEFFDNGENTGGYYWFSNDEPFTHDDVWLAYALPYPLAYTEDHIDTVLASPWVGPTPSADVDLVIGLSNDGTLTDVGRFVPQQNIYAYRISDLSVPGPKTIVMLVAGNHPNETTGTYMFEGTVDFLLSDDPRAAALRQAAEIHVYPQVNPDGRWAGHARSNPENPLADHNRYWDDPEGFTDLTVVTTAMQDDTGTDTQYFLDYHAYHNNSTNAIYAYPEQLDCDFLAALTRLEPAISVLTGSSPPDSPGVARHWAHSPEGLDAEYTFTIEAAFLPGWQPYQYMLVGQSYGLALYEAIVLGGCPDVTTSGVPVFEDNFDAGTSGWAWDLFITSDDYTADFAFDYSVHGIPSAPNSSGGTTVGVKFTVNNNDPCTGTEALSAYPIGQTFSGHHALKFDMWINYNGGSGGGDGSTEFMTAGVGQGGTQVVWAYNPASDGYFFAVTGEGGASQDYRAYDGATMLVPADGVYVAGSQDHHATLYQSLFPSPEYETQGVPGKHWVEVEVRRVGSDITWLINGSRLAVVTDASVQPGNVMIGYMDVFVSVADPAADNYIIYDNVRVERLPEPDCNSNTVPDACELIAGGDFDSSGNVDLDDYAAFADCLAGPQVPPTPSEPTCAHACLDAFDFDGDQDLDLEDYAAFQAVLDAAP